MAVVNDIPYMCVACGNDCFEEGKKTEHGNICKDCFFLVNELMENHRLEEEEAIDYVIEMGTEN